MVRKRQRQRTMVLPKTKILFITTLFTKEAVFLPAKYLTLIIITQFYPTGVVFLSTLALRYDGIALRL